MSSSLLLDVTSFHSLEPLDDSFVNRDHPSFLPPSIFSKFDKPTNYGYVLLQSSLYIYKKQKKILQKIKRI